MDRIVCAVIWWIAWGAAGDLGLTSDLAGALALLVLVQVDAGEGLPTGVGLVGVAVLRSVGVPHLNPLPIPT